LERLEQNARSIGLEWPFEKATLIQTILRHYQPEAPVCRLTALPQVDGYGDFYRQDAFSTRLILSCRSTGTIPENLSLQTIRYQRPFTAIKLNAMADLILMKRQARQAGFDDILLLNDHEHISEASTANIFFIRQGTLLTPSPERDHCLPGITRLQVLEAARAIGVDCQEQSIITDDISTMDGTFLTNASHGITPVQRIDPHTLPWPNAAKALFSQLQHALQGSAR
jgi:branched-subunit amino acid aminotransferase/4-amino-4-deoxychorismate lyase